MCELSSALVISNGRSADYGCKHVVASREGDSAELLSGLLLDWTFGNRHRYHKLAYRSHIHCLDTLNAKLGHHLHCSVLSTSSMPLKRPRHTAIRHTQMRT